MKNFSINPFLRSRKVKKLLMTMKLTAFMLLASLLQVSATVYSQATKFSFKAENKQVVEVLKEIEEMSNFRFFYIREQVDVERRVSVKANGATVEQILDEMFADQGVGYKVMDDNLVLLSPDKNIREIEAVSQQKTITGKVTDNTGQPLPGVTVVIKGTTQGTVTNTDGEYSLSNIPDNSTLQFSFVGMRTQEVVVGSQTTINVSMVEDAIGIEEVVTIGYGVQKKVNVSGAVATISAEKLKNRPVMNLSTALEGLAPGVRITQGSGNPGNESVSIQMRGITSTNGSSPLVLVDGTPADMTVLNSEDVESISFLKDAAASAIYGSRGGSGVILVTTKKGKKEKPRVTFSTLFAQTKPITDLTFMSSTADWMDLHNIARKNSSPTSGDDYVQSTIDEWRAANANPNGTYTNPMTGQTIPNWLAYPNTDWAQILFQPNYYSKHNIQVAGGSETTTFMLSLGYQTNPGTLKNTGMDRFNIRANVETKIGNLFTFGTQTWATKEYKDPGQNPEPGSLNLLQAFPGMTPEYDGKYGASEDPNSTQRGNMLQQVAAKGGQNEYIRINTTWYSTVNLPLEGLVGEARFNYNEYMSQDENYSQLLPTYSFRESFETPKEGMSTLDQATSYRYTYNSKAYTANLLLRYNNTFGKHDISAIAGYEQYWTESSGFSATKKGLLDWKVTDISSAATMESISGSSKQGYAMLSYFGRAGYIYDGKYILEVNSRSDFSSRFAPGNRGSFFPSGSIAWRISEENFYSPIKPYVNYLKLRTSYGSLGNVVSGNYAWQALYGKVNNVLNEQVANGVIQRTQQNPFLSWEKVYTMNVGLDARFVNDRLGAEIDVYQRKTKDMLGDVLNYLTLGNDISAQKANLYAMRNKGFELNLTWTDNIKNFKYGVGLNTTYNRNELTQYNGALTYAYDETTNDAWGNPGVWRYTNLGKASTGGGTRRAETHMIDEWYLHKPYQGLGTYYNQDGSVNPAGGPNDGMIRTKADLEWVNAMVAAGYSFNNKKVGPEAANIWYGQVLMSDENGDGIYGGTDDNVFTGKSTTPKWIFGLNMNAEWKGFDLSMNWSARLGSFHYINDRGANSSLFANIQDVMPADAWSMYYFYNAVAAYNDFHGTGATYDPAADPDANINAKYPRLLTGSSMMTASTFYLYNTSYMKLKSLQIGYSLPKKWLGSSGISNLRVFLAGENLLTIKSKDFPAVDPELGSSLIVYPIARLVSGGVTVTF